MDWTKEQITIAAGQRICAGFTGTSVTPELREVIKEHKIGNILLFSRNVESLEQLRALCANLRELILTETGLPPFIMIDEECGAITRIGHLAGNTPARGACEICGRTTDLIDAKIEDKMGVRYRKVCKECFAANHCTEKE